MDFGIFKEVWEEVVRFFDRMIGWLNYVVNGAEDPYAYDNFWPFPWDEKPRDHR